MKSSLFLLLLLVVSSIYAKPLVDEKDTEVKRDEDVEDASWPRTMEAADMNDSDGYNNVDVNDADMDQDTAMDYSALYDAEALKRYYDDERPQAYDTTDTTKVYEPEMWIFAADDKQQHPTIDKPEHMPLNEMPSIVNWYYNKTSKKWIWRETPKWPELNTELDELPSIVNWKFNKTSKLWFYKVPTPVKAIADSSTPYKDMSRVPLNELPSIVNWHFDNDTKRWFYREVPAYPSDGTPLDELPSIVNWHFDKENKLWSYKEPETDMPDNIDDDEDGPHMKKKPAPPHEDDDDDDDKTPKKPPHEHEEDDDDDDDKTPKKPPHEHEEDDDDDKTPKKSHHEHEEDDDDDDDKTPKKPNHHHKKKENPVDLSKVPSTEIKRWMEKVMKRGEDKSMLGLASDNTRIIVSQNKQGEIESIEGAFVLIDADDLATAAKWDGKYNNMALDDDDDDDDYNPFTDDFDVDIYLIDKKGNLVKIEFSRKSVPIDKLINNKNSTDIPSAIIDKLIQANKNATEEEVVIVVAETTNSTVSTTTTTTEAMTTTTTEAVTTTEAPNSSTTSTVITVESTEPSTEPEKPPKPPKILPPPVDKLMSSIKNWRWDNEKKEWFYAN